MANFLTKILGVEPEELILADEGGVGSFQQQRIQYPPGAEHGGYREGEVFPYGAVNWPTNVGDDAVKLGAASSLVHACVERIISRATAADFYTEPHMPLGPPIRPHLRMSPYHWYRRLFEQLLYTGNALVWLDPDQGNFHVGLTYGSSFDQGQGVWNIAIDRDRRTVRRRPNEGMIHFYLGRQEGLVPHLSPSPVEKCREALMLHNETRELLTDYAANGHRLAGVFQGTDTVTNMDALVNLVLGVKKQLEVKAKRFATVAMPKYLEYKPTGQVPHPVFEGVDIALREIARVYGVPPELLGLLGYRGDFMATDNHLLTEAVYPLLDSVCGTWSETLGVDVSYWPLSLHRATLNSATHTLLGLAQTGALTINELRKLAGLSRLPDYDIMPMTAGAPEREGGDAGGRNGSKNRSGQTSSTG